MRITPTIDGQRTVLRVAGRLQSEDVSELDEEIRAVDGTLVLDLSELLSADKVGIERLRDLASRRADLRGVSRYMQQQMSGEKGAGFFVPHSRHPITDGRDSSEHIERVATFTGQAFLAESDAQFVLRVLSWLTAGANTSDEGNGGDFTTKCPNHGNRSSETLRTQGVD